MMRWESWIRREVTINHQPSFNHWTRPARISSARREGLVSVIGVPKNLFAIVVAAMQFRALEINIYGIKS
jgi:hypothetical protein